MAYSAPRTWSPGEVPTAAQFNQDMRDNVAFLANPPACRVRETAAQNLVNNTLTAITFTIERHDTDSMHSTSSNTSRITFNTAGLYTVGGCVETSVRSDYTEGLIGIRLNGSTYLAFSREVPTATSFALLLSVTTVYKFAAADYVELIFRQQNSAAATPTTLITGNYSPEFWAVWEGLG